jgi:hypothetical protein
MKDAAKQKIIFVYNADSGVFNLLSDVAHKMFSPQTYSCNLCAVTHSNFGMKKEWKDYLDSIDNPLEFLHADESKSKYPSEKAIFPAIFIEENESLKQIADHAQINKSRTIEDLKFIIDGELNK